MKHVVFYSWQSDLPSKCNQGLIQDALDIAIESIAKDEAVELEPVRDRDTAGASGSPNIVNTILSKIEACDVFVADVSIIGCVSESNSNRLVINPNVNYELGYARHAVGESRVIQVMNTHYGDEEGLPFDIRQTRVMKYSMAPNEEPAVTRKGLAKSLERALRMALSARQEQLLQELRRKKEGVRAAVGFPSEGGGDPVDEIEVEVYDIVARPSSAVRALEAANRFRKPPASAQAKSMVKLSGVDFGFDRYASDSVREYERQFIEYTDALDVQSNLAGHSVQLQLAMWNSGTEPAQRVEVELTFPDSVWEIMPRADFEKKIEELKSPARPRMMGGIGAALSMMDQQMMTPGAAYGFRHLLNIDTEDAPLIKGLQVWWDLPRLPHKRRVFLPIAFVHIHPFSGSVLHISVPYTIHADNLPDPVVGELNLLVSRADCHFEDRERQTTRLAELRSAAAPPGAEPSV